MLCFIQRVRRSELSAETRMSDQRFFGGDKRPRPHNFVFHRLDAEPTDPPPMEAITNSRNVSRGAILCKSAGIAFHTLDLRRTLHRRRRLRVGVWQRHRQQHDNEVLSASSALVCSVREEGEKTRGQAKGFIIYWQLGCWHFPIWSKCIAIIRV